MIYILCPANLETGGPELLHQLGYKLNLLGIETNITYINKKENVDPVCDCYRKYNVPYSDTLELSSDTLVIVPEIYISFIQQLKNCRCVIWWLSVDYAKYKQEDMNLMIDNPNIYHLVQSQYALEYLRDSLNISKNVFYLSDYLNSAFFDPTKVVHDSERSNVVVFNPKKGANKTANIIFSSDYRIKWQALNGLTPEQMREVMRKAKVYIDFGSHPGKDRIPREAAMCGCCIITNRSGAAANNIDVDIPDKYKFENDNDAVPVLECINGIFEQYSEKKMDFIPYINKISHEFIEFEKDTVKFFGMFKPECKLELETEEQYIECMLTEIQNEDYGKALLYLINYRIQGFDNNLTIDILETVIRMGIHEYAEAEICAFRGIEKDERNYELYLNLAQIGLLTKDSEKCMKYVPKAIECSKGTPDEEYIIEACKTYLSM